MLHLHLQSLLNICMITGEILHKMRLVLLTPREKSVELEAPSDISLLHEYTIAILQGDNVADPNSCPGANGCVIEPKLKLFIFMVKAHCGENC